MGQKERLSKAIQSVTLLAERPPLFRLNVLPFVPFYLCSLYFYLFDPHFSEFGLVGCFVVLFFQIISFLFLHWSVDYRARVAYIKVNDIKRASAIKVDPFKHKGSKQICPIVSKTKPGEPQQIYFEYQKRKFLYSPETGKFSKLAFPIGLLLSDYLHSHGLDDEIAAQKLAQYGENKFHIPHPTFSQLYKEQALAPFFAFQVFCVALWMLDEYWYFALFTLGMLLLFEATVVKSRLKNMTSLRQMATRSPQSIYVYRKRAWKLVPASELLPGDLCSLVRMREDSEGGKSVPEGGQICPADMLLLSGGLVANEAMLTGESTPHHKEAAQARTGATAEAPLDMRNDKLHIVFGGTQIMQHTPTNLKFNGVPPAPDKGCLAYVLRTGFDTSQGRLMRTILFSSERVTADTWESLVFILFLLIFALAAAAYVLNEGLKDTTRSRYKLLLNCTLIITSVVPPELPMELSLAVNTSLIALARLGIFCTEPFRIPSAGKVDICCFDKTGTLTTDELVMRGVAGLPADSRELELGESSSEKGDASARQGVTQDADKILRTPLALPEAVTLTLAGCHSLIFLDGQLIGDPMEAAALKAIEWTLTKNDLAAPVQKGSGKARAQVRVLQRWHFSSELKRMSTVGEVERNGKELWIFAKGAPEVMQERYAELPANYVDVFKYYMRMGRRVIALGYKKVDPRITPSSVSSIPREDAEKDLHFAGFVVFECPLKPDSLSTITTLKNSSHKVAMITGDNTLTACQVAKELTIIDLPALILTPSTSSTPGKPKFDWISANEAVTIPLDDPAQPIPKLIRHFDLCVSGDTLGHLINDPMLRAQLHYVKVFARVSPEQKDAVVTALKESGFGTLMAGDGTNDVGALKQAHIGVALLNKPDAKPKPRAPPSQAHINPADNTTIQPKNPQVQLQQRRTAGSNALATPAPNPAQRDPRDPYARMNPRTAELLRKMQEDTEEVPLVQLGDASIAAPFTSKGVAVTPIAHIIRQGRCTLVTTLQMYKILALNCLVSAYSLSVLYLDGVKLGDSQATVSGMLIAFCFLFISRAQPLSTLSKQKPDQNIFSAYVFFSIIGQFAVHLSTLIFTVNLCKQHLPPDFVKPAPDSEFKPNLVNSAVFLLSCAMQVATFTINYRGHPFMQSLREYRPLLYALVATFSLSVLGASEMFPEWNESFELVPFPNEEFRNSLLAAIFADLGGAWLVEKISRFLFSTA
eukprot:Phypoly_transcript_00224.p1 GENE.Phypoly_transcript_00224~~Phypoly_transcript_00224.p1  ORF type:complete len:1213 (-),score=244.37 Phypoly_transcript_00224:27-3665(-)